jgi:hypothetical protein
VEDLEKEMAWAHMKRKKIVSFALLATPPVYTLWRYTNRSIC